MAALHGRLATSASRGRWERRAADLRAAMNRVCWNGRFYTHFVKLTPVTIPGVDEAAQLSLSNPMDINRGAGRPRAGGVDPARIPAARRRGPGVRRVVLDRSAVPRRDLRRRAAGGRRLRQRRHHAAGRRRTGPGGLRARIRGLRRRHPAALLRDVARTARDLPLVSSRRPARSVETSTSPMRSRPTAGVRARWRGRSSKASPASWIAAGRSTRCACRRDGRPPASRTAEVSVGYAASGAAVSYRYRRRGARITLDVEAAGAQVQWHVLLPARHRAVKARCAGCEVAPETCRSSPAPTRTGPAGSRQDADRDRHHGGMTRHRHDGSRRPGAHHADPDPGCAPPVVQSAAETVAALTGAAIAESEALDPPPARACSRSRRRRTSRRTATCQRRASTCGCAPTAPGGLVERRRPAAVRGGAPPAGRAGRRRSRPARAAACPSRRRSRWNRSCYDLFLTQEGRIQHGLDPETYVRQLARVGLHPRRGQRASPTRWASRAGPRARSTRCSTRTVPRWISSCTRR